MKQERIRTRQALGASSGDVDLASAVSPATDVVRQLADAVRQKPAAPSQRKEHHSAWKWVNGITIIALAAQPLSIRWRELRRTS